MELRSSDEIKTNVEKCAKRLITLLVEKKEIDAQIKDLKQEFKEEGVAVGMVTAAINFIKAKKKKTDSEIFEQEAVTGILENNIEINNQIGILAAK